jgi:tetratricopeptide (TPR) repeat protein
MGKRSLAIFKGTLLSLLAAGVTLLTVYGQQIPKAQEHYDRGLELAKEEKFHDATEQFTQAIAINPEFNDAYYQLGLSALGDNRPQDAIHAFMQLSQLQPTNSKPILAAAQLYFGLGFMDDALALSVRALMIEAKNPSIYFNIGLIYLKQKHPPQAIDALEHAISLDPTMKKARLLLATAYTDSGKPDGAIRTLQDGIRLNPESPDLMVSLGEAYLVAGRLPEAEAEFRSTISANKDYIPGHIGLATVYRRQRQFPKAIAELTEVLGAEPKAFNALLERGISYYEEGDPEAARRDLDAFSQAVPGRPEGFYYLGLIELNQDHYESAITNLRKMLELAPESCDGQTHLAKAYMLLGKFDVAEQSMTGCLGMTPPDKSASQLFEEIEKRRAGTKK